MDYQYICDEQALEAACSAAKDKGLVTIDTEFIRTRTLNPLVGLFQLYDGEQLSLIDPDAIDNLSSLAQLLTDEKVMKVIHSFSEDLEVFKTALGVKPVNMFDTQIAAQFLGLGDCMGYGRMIQFLLDIELDKGESRTDWLARPLRQEQLNYAAADVYYLMPAFQKLKASLEQQHRIDWVLSECDRLIEKRYGESDSAKAYFQTKNSWQLRPNELNVLKRLASWRLDMARKKNMALNFIVKEVNLVTLAKRQPTNKPELSKVPGLTPPEIRYHGDDLLKCIANAKNEAPEVYPAKIERLIEFPSYKKIFSNLKSCATRVAQQQGISLDLLASKKQINQYITWCWQLNKDHVDAEYPDIGLGWRKPLLWDEFLAILPPNEHD